MGRSRGPGGVISGSGAFSGVNWVPDDLRGASWNLEDLMGRPMECQGIPGGFRATSCNVRVILLALGEFKGVSEAFQSNLRDFHGVSGTIQGVSGASYEVSVGTLLKHR